MELLVFLLPFFFTHLLGLFDGAQTARKDYQEEDKDGHKNKIWIYIQKQGKDYEAWYVGGNDKYPAGNPLKCDFWHFMKFGWTFCISMIALSVVWATLVFPSYWLLLYAFLYGVEGFSFSFYYSYVFRTDKTFKEFLAERDWWFVPFVKSSNNS